MVAPELGSCPLYRTKNMSGHAVVIGVKIERRFGLAAERGPVSATRVKSATGRRIHRAGHVAFQHHSLLFPVGVGHRHGGVQRARVWWLGSPKVSLVICALYY